MKEKEQLVGFDAHDYCPFVREKTEQALCKLLKEFKPKKVLEIGTFLGYSEGVILENLTDCEVVTVEKDEQNAQNACKNLQQFSQRVKVVNADAFDFLTKNEDVFVFIFLDGAKGQYYKYLPYLDSALKVGGVLVADDVLFYGLVNSKEKIKHKHRSIVNNLRKFLDVLQNSDVFETEVFDFDDGLSVSIKRK